MCGGNIKMQDDRVKIFEVHGAEVRGSEVICFAASGQADMATILVDWIKEGCPVTDVFKEDNFSMIIVTEEACFTYGQGANDLLEIECDESMGSGGDFALTAMHMGKDAKAAVAVAAGMDVFSGGQGMFINCRVKNPKLKKYDL